MGKECSSRLRKRLWGWTKYELPYKRLRGRLQLMGTVSRYCSKSFVLQRTRPRFYNSEEGKTKHQEAQISETLMRFRLMTLPVFLQFEWCKHKGTNWRRSNRPIRLTQCCTQFKSPGDKILCVLHLHYNVAFTFK